MVREVVAQNQWPLFGATAIGIIAFAAIGLSEDATGEYANSLFWVILISLSLSWVSSITVTPLLSYLLFKPIVGGTSESQRSLRRLPLPDLPQCSDPGPSLPLGGGGCLRRGLRRVALRLHEGRSELFPARDRPQFMVDVFLPAGTHIRETEAFAGDVQQYIQAQPGVTHVTSFIGGGGLRFLLVYSPERENRAFVQFLVDVDDWRKIDGLIADIQKYLDEQHPNANAVAKKFLLGPARAGAFRRGSAAPIRPSCANWPTRREQILEDDGGAVCVRSDWREPVKVIRPDLLELQARRNGITRVEVAQALQTSFEGRVVGFYREPGDAGTGVYPQETRLLADRRPSAAGRARATSASSTACRSGARSPGG